MQLYSECVLNSAKQVTSKEVNIILKLLNSMKTTGTDETQKLVKLVSDCS